MDSPSQKVTRLISEGCVRYPGGLRAVFQAVQSKCGRRRSESSFYADFNPNLTSNGNLRVADFMAATEVIGDYEALRYMAAYFGFVLTRLESTQPDAPTIEAEMLQDYPALVDFHKALNQFRKGEVSYEVVLGTLDALTVELRQTAAMAKHIVTEFERQSVGRK